MNVNIRNKREERDFRGPFIKPKVGLTIPTLELKAINKKRKRVLDRVPGRRPSHLFSSKKRACRIVNGFQQIKPQRIG